MELFHIDSPITEISTDFFQRHKFSKRIASLIDKNKFHRSLVVGIYGKWGDGKTSALNLISSEIDDAAVQIKFNPWYFNDDKELIKAFFESIAAALRTKLDKREKIIKIIEDYSDSIGSLTGLLVPAGKVIAESGKKIASTFKKEGIEHYKKKVEDLIIKADTNFVVFIDDIDRLNIDEIQSVFKLVKLVGDFPRFSYVLAFDYEHVAASLSHKFGDKKMNSGYEFLEKIIQIPLHLPKPNPFELREYTLKLLKDLLEKTGVTLTDIDAQDFLGKFDSAFVPALKNPRMGARLANAVAFSAPLLSGEANSSDLMIVECMRIVYPDLYNFIRNNPQFFLRDYDANSHLISQTKTELKNNATKRITAVLEKYDPQLKNDIEQMLIYLFPQLQSLFTNTGYAPSMRDDWYINKRICSAYYFERYFSYVVKKGDISDVFFNELLIDLGKLPPKDFANRLIKELSKIDVTDFIFKLKYAYKKFNQEEAKNLFIALSQIGTILPNLDAFFKSTPKEDISLIIRSLIEMLPKDLRTEYCKQAIKLANPIDYALIMYKKLAYRSNRIEETHFLSDDEIKEVANPLIDLFLQKNRTVRVLRDVPDSQLYDFLHISDFVGRKEDVKAAIFNEIHIDHSTALNILKAFTPSIPTTKAQSFKIEFTEEHFDFLSSFVEPKKIYDVLTHDYGDMKSKLMPSYESFSELSENELIGLFQKIFEERNKPDERLLLLMN